MKKFKYSLTKGSKRMGNEFEYILYSGLIDKNLAKIQKKFFIPTEGLGQKSFSQWLLDSHHDYQHPPREWKYAGDIEMRTKLVSALEKLLDGFDLSEDVYERPIWQYCFFKHAVVYGGYFAVRDACRIEDAVVNDWSHNQWKGFSFDDSIKEVRDYPVLVHISSEASFNEIKAFLQKHMNEIKQLQAKYKKREKIKVRTRTTLKRDRYIYNNRHLPRKDIVKLVKKIFHQEGVDEIYVRNIIAREKKRREV